jgi:hypothetical protein
MLWTVMPSVYFAGIYWIFGWDGPWQGWLTHTLPGQICDWILCPKVPIDNFLLRGILTYIFSVNFEIFYRVDSLSTVSFGYRIPLAIIAPFHFLPSVIIQKRIWYGFFDSRHKAIENYLWLIFNVFFCCFLRLIEAHTT